MLGLAVLGVGIYSRVENDTWRDLIDSDTFLDASNLLVAAGVIVAILGFFGCLGALKKLKLLLCIVSLIYTPPPPLRFFDIVCYKTNHSYWYSAMQKLLPTATLRLWRGESTTLFDSNSS